MSGNIEINISREIKSRKTNQPETRVELTQSITTETELLPIALAAILLEHLVEIEEDWGYIKEFEDEYQVFSPITIKCNPSLSKDQREKIKFEVEKNLKLIGWLATYKSGYPLNQVKANKPLELSFLLSKEIDYTEIFAYGVWLDDSTLRYEISPLVTDRSVIDENLLVSIKHWHPGSMCSGSWYDSIVLLDKDLVVERKYIDDEGWCLIFTSLKNEKQETLEDIIYKIIESWELSVSADFILKAYMLGFRGGSVDVLLGENSGYELEEIYLKNNSDIIKSLLRTVGNITPFEAMRWLNLIPKSVFDYYLNEENDEGRLIRLLTEISNQKGGAGE
jgi:hypothetical protein